MEVLHMFRFLSALTLGVAFLAYASPARADDKDASEVKLEGNICCGKCELKESDKCAVTIVVEKDKKKTTYWFDPTPARNTTATSARKSSQAPSPAP